jgi:hypothetical protein
MVFDEKKSSSSFIYKKTSRGLSGTFPENVIQD